LPQPVEPSWDVACGHCPPTDPAREGPGDRGIPGGSPAPPPVTARAGDASYDRQPTGRAPRWRQPVSPSWPAATAAVATEAAGGDVRLPASRAGTLFHCLLLRGAAMLAHPVFPFAFRLLSLVFPFHRPFSHGFRPFDGPPRDVVWLKPSGGVGYEKILDWPPWKEPLPRRSWLPTA